jgi:hypothetical protein
MRLIGVSLGAAGALAASLGHAQEVREDLTSMLPCEGSCAVTTRQEYISGEVPTFPTRYSVGGYPAEAVVEITFTVLPDGTIGEDMEVTRALGPPGFVDAAKSALRAWKYKPATLDGKPVANSGAFRTIFKLGDGSFRDVRNRVATVYDEGRKLVEEGKLAEAKAKLSEPLALSLNFYERGLLLHLLALIAVQEQNFADAQQHASTAMIFPQESMTPAMWTALRRINILSLLNLGDIVGAVNALDRWKKVKDFDPSDSVVLEIEAARKRMDAMPVFAAKGRIPAANGADGFNFGLYRRKFTFANVRGRLDRFNINCEQRQSRSPISEGVEWNIPRNFSNCFLFIKGEPGTTFDIVQFAN